MSTRIVSVIVPCRNERRYIEAFCAGVMSQKLAPGWRLELIVADGDSDDGTRQMLKSISSFDERMRTIDNLQRIVSTGLNAALEIASGEVIVRMDVHTEYADDYVAQCIAVLQETGADNVGGPWRAEADASAGPMQRAVAAAFQSRWVAGGALSRQLDYNGWVDTVYLGSWPKKTFERFGGFDENLVRNQDDEHNLRITRGGGHVWQSSRIHSTYRPRASLGKVFRQYLQYGYWKPFVMKKHGQAASVRHVIPGVFVAVLTVAWLLGAFGVTTVPAALLLALYLAGVAGLTAAVARAQPMPFGVTLRVPAVIAAYHFGYGIGSLIGWYDVLTGAKSRGRFARLTR